jgi:hypothetical protein
MFLEALVMHDLLCMSLLNGGASHSFVSSRFLHENKMSYKAAQWSARLMASAYLLLDLSQNFPSS